MFNNGKYKKINKTVTYIIALDLTYVLNQLRICIYTYILYYIM